MNPRLHICSFTKVLCCEASYSLFFLQIGHGIPSLLQLVANHWLLCMEVIAFFKSGLLQDLQKMVMPLMWMHKSSSKALFTKVPWNPRSVSTSCCLEGYSICFQNLHHSLLAESYLANLALYPGRSELPFLPANTQVLIHFILEILLHWSIYLSNWYLFCLGSWFFFNYPYEE